MIWSSSFLHFDKRFFIPNTLFGRFILGLTRFTATTKDEVHDVHITSSKSKLDEETSRLREKYDEYRTFPHKHPNYVADWQNFYSQRKAELRAGN